MGFGNRLKGLVVLLAVFVLWAAPCAAEEAADITGKCKISSRINSKEIKLMLDDKYTTRFASGTGERAAIDIELPEGETAGGVYIKWANTPPAIRVQVKKGDTYETIATCDTPYWCDYIELPEGIDSFRILQGEKVPGRMYIAELRVFSRGETPDYVQRWSDSWAKADLLVISTHPDDELIFFGGVIPYYAGEMEMAVQVAYVVPAMPHRRLELLDGLWHCGVTHYPVVGNFADKFSNKMEVIQKAWGKNRLDKFIVELYREFQPEVVVAQDVRGEYGHGAHKAVSDAAQRAVKLAADEKYEKKAAKETGTWQIKKLYLHLYKEGQIKMDWRVPLTRFNGKSAFDIAEEAFLLHRSQQKGDYFVEDFGPYDNSLFGLYYTGVGADTNKNDFFENVFD